MVAELGDSDMSWSHVGSVHAIAGAHFDVKSIPKQEAFSGKDADWREFSFTFKSYAYTLGIGSTLAAAEALPEAPVMSDMVAEVQEQSVLLYHLLIQVCKGKSRKVCMAAEEGNGFRLWWDLKREYEKPIPGRFQSWLCQLLNPKHWADSTAENFVTLLMDWELSIVNYEKQSGKKFDEDNKIATVIADQ